MVRVVQGFLLALVTVTLCLATVLAGVALVRASPVQNVEEKPTDRTEPPRFDEPTVPYPPEVFVADASGMQALAYQPR